MADTFLKVIDLALQTLLHTRFQSILGLDSTLQSVLLVPREIALRQHSEIEGMQQMEFINFWKTHVSFDWNRQRTTVARRGMHLAYTDGERTAITNVKAVPANLEYDVWFWSTYKEKINEVIESYLFWQHEDPFLTAYFNDLYALNMNMSFGDIDDESSISDLYSKGQYFVAHAPIALEGWILKGTTVGTIKKILLWIYDEDDISDREEYVVERGHIPGGITTPDPILQLHENEFDLTEE